MRLICKILAIGLLLGAASAQSAGTVQVEFSNGPAKCPIYVWNKKANGKPAARCKNKAGKPQSDAVCAVTGETLKFAGNKAFEIQGLPSTFTVTPSGNKKKADVKVPSSVEKPEYKYTVHGVDHNCDLDPRIIIGNPVL